MGMADELKENISKDPAGGVFPGINSSRENSFVGRELGGCRIEKILGVGGNGTVYLGRDIKLDRPVAIKILNNSQYLSVDGETVTRFIREARAIAKLDHPNILHVYDVDRNEGCCYIIMQFIEGQTLQKFLSANGKLSILDALIVTMQIAQALDAVHKLDLIHRDIKPSNVMIESSGRIRVMDFGFARRIDEDQEVTQAGVYVGTPRYSSPEQCETLKIDHRSDLYSLGVIFYEMLAGKVPYEAETPLALMKKIVCDPLRPVREFNPDVPDSVNAVLESMLAKNPAERCASEQDLVGELEKLIDALKQDPALNSESRFCRGISFSDAKFSSGINWRRQRNLSIAAIIAFVAAVGIFLGIFYFKGMGPQSASGKLQQPLKMAIYDFDNATRDNDLQWLELGIPDMLTGTLAQNRNLSLITRDQVLWNSGKEKKRFDDAFREQLMSLEPRIIVNGTIYKNEKDVRIVVHLYRFPDNESIGSVSENGSVSDVFSAIDKLAVQLNKFLVDKKLPELANVPVREAAAARSAAGPTTKDLFMEKVMVVASRPPSPPAAALRFENDAQKAEDSLEEAKSGRGVQKRKVSAQDKAANTDSGMNMNAKKLQDRREMDKANDEQADTASTLKRDQDEAKASAMNASEKERTVTGAVLSDKANVSQGIVMKKGKVLQADPQIILPYYYRGQAILEKQKLSRGIFEKKMLDLKTMLLKADMNPGQLDKSFGDWEKSMTPSSGK